MNPAFVPGDDEQRSADGRRSLELDVLPKDERNVKVNEVILDDDDHRDKWTNPVEFLLSCISVSVGLGNIWRFPYVAYSNGLGKISKLD